MKAWLVEDPAAPDPLTWRDLPAPSPGAGQSLLAVEAAAVNFSDLLMIRGKYQVRPPLPFVPGQEVAGRVLRSGGKKFLSGRRVVSKVVCGGFAEQVVIDDAMGAAVPEGMALEHAAALPVAYTTALLGLKRHGRLQRGETVLVHAAAGALGLAAVEIAKAEGATVLATAGSAAKLEIARQHGADAAWDYGADAWPDAIKQYTDGRGVDVVFDSVGGKITEQSLRCLAHGGRLLIAGFSSGMIPAIPANRLLLRNAAAIGVYWSHERDAAAVDAAMNELLALYARGTIRPLVDTRFRLEDLPAALAALQARQIAGKLVLRTGGAG